MRKIKWISLCMALLLFISGCSAVSPKEKTILLREQNGAAQEAASPGSVGSFEFRKRYTFPFDKLNPDGVKPPEAQGVIAWLDDDTLLALSCQLGQDGSVTGEIGRVSYQYGFYEAVLGASENLPEFITLSRKKDTISYQLENEELGKYTVVYSLASQRELLRDANFRVRSLPIWSHDDRYLGIAAYVNGRYAATAIDAKEGGSTSLEEAANEGISILDFLSDGSLLLRRQSGEDRVYSLEMIDMNTKAVNKMFMGYVGAASALGPGSALVLSGNTLRYISPTADGAVTLENGIQAYGFSENRQYIALAQLNMDGSVDIAIGRWSGSRVINKNTVYKNTENVNIKTVTRLLMSPDTKKLYVEGLNAAGAVEGVVLEFS